jgi:hypothetical protein
MAPARTAVVAANAKSWGAGLLAAIAMAAAGCGSDDNEAAEGASLDPAVAERLAQSSEAIADSLESDDVCGAAGEADDLAREVSEAEMPQELRAEAEAAAAELVNSVNCEPEPVDEEMKEDREKGEKDEGDGGEGDGNGDGGDGGSGSGETVPPGHGGEPPGQVRQGAEGGFE